MSHNGWIGVDLDGTLAYYDKWRGMDHIGDPIPAMAELVKEFLRMGLQVKVFTARWSEPDPIERNRFWHSYRAWCLKHFGHHIPVTNVKDFHMIELYDDRAVTVEHNTGRLLAESTRHFGVALKEEAQRAVERGKDNG